MKELMMKLMSIAGICKLHTRQLVEYGPMYFYAFPTGNSQWNLQDRIGPFIFGNKFGNNFIARYKKHNGCYEEYLLQYALKNKCCVSFYDGNFNKKTLVPKVGSLEELQIYVDLNMKGPYDVV